MGCKSPWLCSSPTIKQSTAVVTEKPVYIHRQSLQRQHQHPSIHPTPRLANTVLVSLPPWKSVRPDKPHPGR